MFPSRLGQHHWFLFALRIALPYGVSLIAILWLWEYSILRRKKKEKRLLMPVPRLDGISWEPGWPRSWRSPPHWCPRKTPGGHLGPATYFRTRGHAFIYRIVSVVDPEWFVSDPTPDPDLTLKEVSALTPEPDPVSDPATLVSASRGLRGKLALYSWNYDDL